jgi:high-affinity Fe2+/Pb2+ permease
MIILSEIKELAWIESFAPVIVLTGFFIFLISAGLFIYGLIQAIKN